VNQDEEQDFREFVQTRFDALRGLAYLTCGDWQSAEDAVSSSLAKLYVRWRKVTSPHSYAQRMVIRAAIDEGRRPWRREHAAGEHLPDQIVADPFARIDERMRLREALRKVPPRQRAVLVLRYYEGLDIEQTAAVLGLRTGTVKSQAARGLTALREALGATEIRTTRKNTKGEHHELRPV
jgi:RNA polymerase sigma-70 factor (sigma-E family)